MKLGVALTALLVGLSGPAAARPSMWQRARDPASARAEQVSREIERWLELRSEADRPDAARDYARGAVIAADHAGAEQLPGVRVQCLLGMALTDAGLYRRAHKVLSRVLPETLESSLASHCLLSASIAAAHLGHTDIEIATLTRTIELGFNGNVLANAYYNRAEAWMRGGDLVRSVADFRRCVALGPVQDLQALCYYGLGVALDRHGDTPSAWQALGVALSIQLPLQLYASDDALDLPTVFFVPPYEVHYYKALSRMAAARKLPEAERGKHYERALKHWEKYLVAGEEAGDRWLTQARLHAATCRRLIEEGDKPKRKQAKRKQASPP